ncbi:hypothetical protein ACI65C_005774 [Semiaphis heraclei]
MSGKRIKLSGAASRKLALENKIKNALVLSQVPKLEIGRTSNYLESKNLDLLAAWEMVDKTSKSISAIEFEDIYKMSEEFSIKMNESLDNFKLSENIVIETELPKARVRSKKRVYGE